MSDTDKNIKDRFSFGRNWQQFITKLDKTRIMGAEDSLKNMLGKSELSGHSFLDVGSGSGLFSLAAARMGAAEVMSFDYDIDSVDCTAFLKKQWGPDGCDWQVCQGSVLDPGFLAGLKPFDIVYSWGVLHHTGAMWQAFENLVPLVKKQGQLFIAIYNDQGMASRVWKWIKKIYNRLGTPFQSIFFYTVWFLMEFLRCIQSLVRKEPPFPTGHQKPRLRGMSYWHDAVDWIGGYPFEVATPREIKDYFGKQGFVLENEILVRGAGCNEFVFKRIR